MLKIIPKFIDVNFKSGRTSPLGVKYSPIAVVVHIMDGSLLGTDEWFRNTKASASTHYGVGNKGDVFQWVKEEDQAWHAGRVDRPLWKKIIPGVNPNLYTIGIEHEGRPLVNDVWPEAQKQASAELIADICKRYNLPIDRDHVIGHYEIFAGKPNCPGVNKGIIDELVARAKAINTPVDTLKTKIAEAKSLLEDAIAILKSI